MGIPDQERPPPNVDVLDETTIGRVEAASLLSVHPDTVTAFIRRGVDGVFLEAVRVGEVWKTSWEACRRFSRALTMRAFGEPESPEPLTPREAKKRHREAEVRLKEAGW